MPGRDGFLIFESCSPWWILLCAGFALCAAWFLYFFIPALKASKWLSWCLAGLRFASIFIISLLLLAPLLSRKTFSLERPVVVLATDNSASLKNLKGQKEAAFSRNFESLREQLSAHYDVQPVSFGDRLRDSLSFNYIDRATDFSTFLKSIYARYENRNLGAIVLASDGIINSGTDPLELVRQQQIPVYCIARGDSSMKPDLAITDVSMSDVAYLDEPLGGEVFIKSNNGTSQKVIVRISSRGKNLFEKPVQLLAGSTLRIPVRLVSHTLGFAQYLISVSGMPGEINLANNRRELFIETIKGKLRVALLAAAPHPDLALLKRAIGNYKHSVVDLQLGEDALQKNYANYDLLVFHQFPSKSGDAQKMTELLKGKAAHWIFFGSQTDVATFNTLQSQVQVPQNFSPQNLSPRFNETFHGFIASDSLKGIFDGTTNLSGPGNAMRLHGLADLVISARTQEQGSSKESPILFFSSSGQSRTAWLMAEGLWRLALHKGQNHVERVDELVQKTVQYLCTREDRRRFRITMPERVIEGTASPEFEAVLFNESAQKLNTPEVSLALSDSAGHRYNYQFSRKGDGYYLKAGQLGPGEYNYVGKTKTNGQDFSASGSFFIKNENVELNDLQANFRLLDAISKQSEGRMLTVGNFQDLPAILEANRSIASIRHEDEKRDELINLKLVFFVLAILLSTEWFVRKYMGSL